ncbi:hypothetical protein, partial [Petrachloros mirabilis]
MIESSRTSIPIRLLTQAAAVYVLIGIIPPAFASTVEDRIMAVVNSDLIMWSEVKRELAPERERIEKLYRGEELARRLKTAES